MVTQPCLQMERTMVLRVDVDGQTVIATLARHSTFTVMMLLTL